MVQTMEFLTKEPSLLPILLGPNIRLETLFSNTLSLHSFLNVRDHVAQLAILLFYIRTLILKFFERPLVINKCK
jgi:hypothetical protein